MLKVIYFIYPKEKIQVPWIYDQDNNELIDPKTGESWFLTMEAWTKILGNNPLFIIIKRTF